MSSYLDKPLGFNFFNPDWVAELFRNATLLEGKSTAEQEVFWDNLDRTVASLQQDLFGPNYTLGEQDLASFRAELDRVAQSSAVLSTPVASVNSFEGMMPFCNSPTTRYDHQDPDSAVFGHELLYSNTTTAYYDGAVFFTPGFSHKQWMKPVPRNQRAESVRSTQPARLAEATPATQSHGYTNGGVVSWAWSDERIMAYRLQLDSMSAKFCVADLPYCALNGPYHPLFSECTAAVVDITILGNLKITVEELLTFFPAHTSWRDFAHRLQRNGWTATPITRMIYYTRGLTDPNLLKRNTIYKQKEASDKALDGVVYNKNNPRPANQPLISVYACGGWDNDKRSKTGGNKYLLDDWYLRDCAKGITIEPAGLGRGLFTEALVHARENNNNPRLSEVNQYVREHGLTTGLLMGPNDPNPDVAALRRMDVMLLNYTKCIGLKK